MADSKSTGKFRVYIAASVDGYLATPDGGVEWLEAFEGPISGTAISSRPSARS